MIRYFGIDSRRSKGKVNFIKMIDKRILSIRKSIANWENRILAIAGVDPVSYTHLDVYKRQG